MFQKPVAFVYMTGVGFCLGLLLGLLVHLPSVSSPREGRSLEEGVEGDPGVRGRFLLAEKDPLPNHGAITGGQAGARSGQVDKDFADMIEKSPNNALLNSLQSNYSERNTVEFTQERINSRPDGNMKNMDVKGSQSDQFYDKYNIPRRQDYDILRRGNPRAKQTKGATYEAAAAFVEGQNGIYLVGLEEKDMKFPGHDPNSGKNEYEHTSHRKAEGKNVPGSSESARMESPRDPATKSKLPDSLPTLPKTNSDTLSQHSRSFDRTDDIVGDRSNNRPPSHSSHVATHQNKMADKSSPLFTRMSDLVSGVYWSPQIETLTPGGFSSEDVSFWRQKVNNGRVIKVEEGCGRMQNRRLVFDDGSKACARYRVNVDQIQGEIFSFYLSRLLGVTRVPPSVLTVANTLDPRWVSVDQHIVLAQWHPRRPAVLTPWVGGLTPAYIPDQLRNDNRSLHPTLQTFVNKTLQDITDLVQWSDLIIFDYLTANLDRVVNNMFNKQWNPDMMDSPAHNLEKSSRTGLVFLDNESGLFHSYRLLDKYSKYHESLLKSLCIFRRQTAANIKRLHRQRNVGELLVTVFKNQEPLNELIPKIPEKNIKILQSRIDDVQKQIKTCESRYRA